MLKHFPGIAAVMFFFALPLLAQPKIVLEGGGKSIEFGEVLAGNKISRNVLITNTGKDTLKISSVRAQCGCTATELKHGFVAPGDSTTVLITFNSNGYPNGKVVKHVYVTSNDSTNANATLEFTANVIIPLMVTPAYFNFNQAKIDSTYEKSLTVTNNSKVPINIDSLSVQANYMTVKLGKRHLAPGESTQLEAVLHPTTSGSFEGVVQMSTDHPAQRKVEVRYLAWVTRK